ncbi:MAG: hypothetical protein MRK02_04705 [Candidatus Scalindua sp.]|nr:hypothetical protein [Candidatus Scalindua sp.]
MGGATPDDVLRNLDGRVLNVYVNPEIPKPDFGDFFRFDRVIGVKPVPSHVDQFKCAHCASTARYLIIVEWESGYECPEGNDVCEQCIKGIVTSGVEAIQFGTESAPWTSYDISLNVNLTSKKENGS